LAENQLLLNWVESADGWLAEVERAAGAIDNFDGSLGATYQVRKHGSPPLFEMRFLWHPAFNYSHLNRDQRIESRRDYRQRQWLNPYLVRQFGSQAEAMKDAQDTEHQRLEQRHRCPDGVLQGVDFEFRSDVDGDRSVFVGESEADLEGWKIETVSASTGTRSIHELVISHWWPGHWEALCDWGNYILRWIPPTE
jgi:hypothetical protein